jgi:hypothetical protein
MRWLIPLGFLLVGSFLLALHRIKLGRIRFAQRGIMSRYARQVLQQNGKIKNDTPKEKEDPPKPKLKYRTMDL